MSVATKKIQIDVNWGALTGHAGTETVTWLALYDSLTSGVLKAVVKLSDPVPIVSGSTLDFPANSILIRLTGSATAVIGDALALAMLDATFGATTLGPTNYYLALMTAAPIGAGTGGTEFSVAGNYARKLVANNGTSFSAAAMV